MRLKKRKQKKENSMKKIALAILAVMLLSSALLGCNAMRGAGEDLSDTGKHISNVGK